MKRAVRSFILAITLLFAAPAAADPIPAKVLYSGSVVGFTAETTLFEVDGLFRRFTVSGTVDADDFEKSKVIVEIEAKSVDTGNSSRDEHLRDPDFFHVTKHPNLRFETTGIRKTGEGKYAVSGNFTILKTTKPVTINVTTSIEDSGKVKVLRVEGGLKVNRHTYGLDYESSTFEPDIKDTVKIKFDLRFLAK